MNENGNRRVQYANKAELMDGIIRKYHPEALLEGDIVDEGGGMPEPEQTEAKHHQPSKRSQSKNRQPRPLSDSDKKDGKRGGGQPARRQAPADAEPIQQEVNADGQT